LPSVNSSYKREHRTSFRQFVYCKICSWNATVFITDDQRRSVKICPVCLSDHISHFTFTENEKYTLTFLSRRTVEVEFSKVKWFCHECIKDFKDDSGVDMHTRKTGHTKIDTYDTVCFIFLWKKYAQKKKEWSWKPP